MLEVVRLILFGDLVLVVLIGMRREEARNPLAAPRVLDVLDDRRLSSDREQSMIEKLSEL
jgi:hypothetical protein